MHGNADSDVDQDPHGQRNPHQDAHYHSYVDRYSDGHRVALTVSDADCDDDVFPDTDCDRNSDRYFNCDVHPDCYGQSDADGDTDLDAYGHADLYAGLD